MLVLSTWRGEPGRPDEPQHDLMGVITKDLVDLMEIEQAEFPMEAAEIEPRLNAMEESLSRRALPYCFVMRKGSVSDSPLRADPPIAVGGGTRYDLDPGVVTSLRRIDALEVIRSACPPDGLMIATTGKAGRELFTLGDAENQFYTVGSMGGASAIGLGAALNRKGPVIVLDGDGAALMKMGNFATIGAEKPSNLLHILLDNAVHDSTGGQPTVSPGVDFQAIALACGYRTAARVADAQALESHLSSLENQGGPHLIHVRVTSGSIDSLGRPTVSPADVAARARAFVQRAG